MVNITLILKRIITAELSGAPGFMNRKEEAK
jgi:hypothetical protein